MKSLKKDKLSIVVLVQVFIIACLLLSMLYPKMDRTYGADELELKSGVLSEGGSAYIDNTINIAGIFLTTPKLNLGYGTYSIDIEYESSNDMNMAYISLPAIMESREDINDRFVSNTVNLKQNSNKKTLDVLIKSKQSDYVAAVFFIGDGSLSVNSIRVYKTNSGTLRLAVIAAVLFVIADCIYLIYKGRKNKKIADESMKIGFMLGGIILFSSIPLMLNYMIEGHDLSFHLLRIEGIKEGIKMGTFPIKIQPNWLEGNGYAASVFYGDILLYIPALLRLCGFNVTESYNIFVFLTNAATCIISYCCFFKLSGSKKAAVVGSMLYTLSLYRLVNIYVRSAVGEYSAMIFLPVIAYGMWKIFTDDIKNPSYKKNYIIPVIGFAGIINTHILTCEMTGAFIILLCLILIKKVFRKETFIVLVKTVIYTCILCAGFLVPFFDYMLQGGFVVSSGQRFTSGIQQFGAFIGQLLVPFAGYSGLSVNVSEGMPGDFPSTAGLAVVTGAVILVYILVMGYEDNKNMRKCSWIMLIFGVLSMWFSSHVFPWDKLQNMNGLFNTLISMISMPWRFLTITSLTFALASVFAVAALERRGGMAHKWVVAALVAIAAVQGGAEMSDIMNNAQPYAVYDAAVLDSTNLIGCEYLPAKGSVEAYSSQYVASTENLTVEQIYRYNNEVIIKVDNSSNETGSVNLSMVYYKGYTAKDVQTGRKFELYPDNGYTIGFDVGSGYSGEIIIGFTGFWYWKAAAIVSVIAAIVIALNAYLVNKNRNIREYVRNLRVRHK